MAEHTTAPPSVQAWHMTLAYTLLKLKPDGVIFKDWLLSLKGHLNHADCEAAHGITQYHDSHCKSLQTQYRESQVEIYRLQQTIAKLAKEKDVLQAQAMEGPKTAGVVRRPTSPAGRAGKKNRTVETIADDSDTELFDGLDLSENQSQVIYQLFRVQEALKEEPISPTVTCHFIVGTVHALKKTLGDMFKIQNHDELVTHFGKQLTSDVRQPVQVINSHVRAIGRVCGIILQNLIFLSDCPKIQGQKIVVANLADFVDDILKMITAHSKRCVETQAGIAKKAKGQEKLLSTLVRMILDVLNLLETGNDYHFEIFEAITWLVFDRAGTLIYMLSQGHEYCNSIEEEIEQGLRAIDSAASITIKDTADIETKYLFHLLKRIKQIAPYHYKARAEPPSTKRGSIVPKQGTLKLSVDAKNKLQHTLVNSIWDEKLDPCADIITSPNMKQLSLALPKGYIEKKSSWFISEMWSMFGWEMLGKDIRSDA